MDIIIAHLPNMALAYLVFFIAVASPGPASLAVAGASMAHGRSQGMAKAAGILSGSVLWGLLSVFGLAAFIVSFEGVLYWLKIVGGLYLLWLGLKAAKSAAAETDPELQDVGSKNLRRQFIGGFLIHVTNPKALFAWGAVITLGLRPDAPWWMGFVVFAGAYMVSVLTMTTFALLFSTKRMMNGYLRLRRWIQGVFAVIFGLAGVKLIFQG